MNRIQSFCAAALVAFVFTGCGVSTEQLTRTVRESMETKLKPKGITIKSLILAKKAGNEYTGVLETLEPNGAFTYKVEVISDGNNMTWQIKP